MRIALFFICCIYCSSSFASSARVAIVIDDIGYRVSDKNALTLPGNITYSILPHTPFALTLSELAHKNHHDVLLHIPMEAENGKKLGPGALTKAMSESQIRQSLQASFAEIPFAIGINNHMGSLLTQLSQPMHWTMRYLKDRQAIFLDSKTTRHSKAEFIAKSLHVPTLHRSVFLDNQQNEPYISKQFQQLIAFAKHHKTAIAIAHPHPETIKVLRKLLPTLKAQGVDLVPISTLIAEQESHPVNNKIAE